MEKSQERIFQDDILDSLGAHGWAIGEAHDYDRTLALYPEDVLAFVQATQPEQWEKFVRHYPQNPEQALLRSVERHLSQYGTLHVLRKGLKDRGARISLCQFKPDHGMNPETLARYAQNILRVVPEVSYSPHQREGYNPRLDLVLFVNGVPTATLELKSEFKQAVENAIRQYRQDRPPKDPKTKKPEPLLAFKRGALVHFAVSQQHVYMTTQLAGRDTFFLPFNQGTQDGGAGNPVNPDGYDTAYLWEDVFAPDAWLKILGRFVHLQVEEKEDFDGRKQRKETLIFPRFHQWQVVNKLIDATRAEGPGERYLIQHSAGSGKSNSIAWTAHQLASLYAGEDKVFQSVIVITDRTVLDSQLQATISQFEHQSGVVTRVNREEGEGSKSEQLAHALEQGVPIIVVTIQTFPYVLEALQKRATLKARHFAVIADEAHSSQTGTTARKVREVLGVEQQEDGEELSAEDMLDAAVASRKPTKQVSYYAFTATPKARTLEMFGRTPNPALEPSADNKPEPFHVYSMRQAIEEGFILDVLKNYTSYKTAWKLAHPHADDEEVDASKASKALAKWVRLHPHNIGQKVEVIVEHFRSRVAHLLNGQAKAMVVTGSRKEAVRYKLALDKYVRAQGYRNVSALVAFSGEVNDSDSGPEPFTETNMNPGLKGRDLRTAFDSNDFNVMLVANKFQTGFDQPKLCAMYVDKKLGGVDCVQTLSRLNRTFPGKDQTFILDFVNEPDDIRAAFEPYYTTAELTDVSDYNQVHHLEHTLLESGLIEWHEVEAFARAFFDPKGKQATLTTWCRPAVDRWKGRYRDALERLRAARLEGKRAEEFGDAPGKKRAESDEKAAAEDKDALDLFKKNLGTFVRYYEFVSQLIDFDSPELEQLAVYARHLAPLLREERLDDDELDLSELALTHYRLTKQRERTLSLGEEEGDYRLDPGKEMGSANPRDPKKAALAEIIGRLNELFGAEVGDEDKLRWANGIADRVERNADVMRQIENNTEQQVMHGDFPDVLTDLVMDDMTENESLAMQVLEDEEKAASFARLILGVLLKRQAGKTREQSVIR